MINVSVIIINYNTFRLTCECIQSVIKQTIGINYEIIVVDNASSECIPDLFSTEFPEIRLIKSDVNLGFAKGNNLGINYAKGDYILLLNSDTYLLNNSIGICYNHLLVNKKIGIVTTRLEYPNGQIQSNCQRFPSAFYNLLELIRFQKIFPKLGSQLLLGSFFNYDKMIKVDWVWGAFFMFPKNVIEQLPSQKLFDEYFMYGEDLWWSWEIRKLRLDAYFIPEGRVIHYMGASNGSKVSEMLKNNEAFLKKNYSQWKIFLLNITHWLLLKFSRNTSR